MKRKIIYISISAFIILSIMVLLISTNIKGYKRENDKYDPELAVRYSYNYVYQRDQNFPVSEYNCTQYISQCLLAGGMQMQGKNTTKPEIRKIVGTSLEWFCYYWEIDPYKPMQYYMSSSFCNLEDFKKYWTNVGNIPYTEYDNTKENRELIRKEKVKIGDVIILKSTETDHIVLVTYIDDKDIYYNANTRNRIEYPLSQISESMYYKLGILNFVQ